MDDEASMVGHGCLDFQLQLVGLLAFDFELGQGAACQARLGCKISPREEELTASFVGGLQSGFTTHT